MTDAGSSARVFKVRDTLLDRYQVFGINKSGGFGLVYFVTDLQTGKEYAVKTYKPEFASYLPDINEFRDEVAFWVRLPSHPNIVKAHFVEEIGGQPFLFLDYIEGPEPTLRDRLRFGALEPETAIRYAYHFCLGMEFANQQGEIAHLDLKPENLLIDRHDTLKVTDFGLAQPVRVMRGQIPRLSRGTWLYAPPERLAQFATMKITFPFIEKGQRGTEDSRSDLFSFGLIFIEMLTGSLPFTVPEGEDIRQPLANFYNAQREQGVMSLTAFFQDEVLENLLYGCLALDTYERYRNFTGLRRELEKTFTDVLLPEIRGKPSLPGRRGQVERSSEDLRAAARSLFLVKQYSEALNLYNKLLMREPDDPDLLVETAQAMQANGQVDGAVLLLEQALTRLPGEAKIRDALKQIQAQS